ncbi:hypothetical protein VP01_3428g3 [Puccinia sorghi]|uniref:Uncharacterized protein n=1 Tax=Puccinia sorghi TaxID=27349 RepID=A0A0L6UWE3_9BASI|nr:hypothetical protein VP01_3428g3 [Puccinia sorghi]
MLHRKQKHQFPHSHSHLLTCYLPKQNICKTKDLLGGSKSNTTQENDPVPPGFLFSD